MIQRTIAYVTPFAKEGEENVNFSALASYTKTLLGCLNDSCKKKVVIIAQLEDEKDYTFDGILVQRAWKRNSHTYIFQIIRQVLKNKSKVVHIQQEIYCYGGIVTAYELVLLILILRLLGRKVVTTIHGVVPIKDLTNKFLAENGMRLPLFIVKAGLYILFRYASLFSNQIIVHNEKLKKLLIRDFKTRGAKINVIPLPLYDFVPQKKSSHLKEIISNDKIILFFGFLARYKGLNKLIEAMQFLDLKKHKAKLVIAGDIPTRFREDKDYLNWLGSLKELSGKISKDRIVWDQYFIPDEELKDYLDSSELVIIPYSDSISSSGPLAYCVMNNTPVLVSEPFRGIVLDEIVYGESPKQLAEKIELFFLDKLFRDKINITVEKQKNLWDNATIGEGTASIYKILGIL